MAYTFYDEETRKQMAKNRKLKCCPKKIIATSMRDSDWELFKKYHKKVEHLKTLK